MSTLKVDGIRSNSASSDAITLAGDGTCTANITNNLSNRNLIINGAMQVNEHSDSNAGVNGTFAVDRFKFKRENTAANFSMTQSTTSPDGFYKSLKIDCTAADTSTAANEFVLLAYNIEAQDLQSLAYGTSGAKPLVLSFYVRSNLTGTYAVSFEQRDNSSKLYARTYTINNPDTWERKTITIPADTSGVINDDNGAGLQINFALTMGSTFTSGSISTAWETYSNAKLSAQHGVNVGGNTANEWLITGVQLEVDHTGSGVATDFEHNRSYAQELALCQRYYYVHVDASGPGVNNGETTVSENATMYSSTDMFASVNFPCQMRTKPSLEVTTGTNWYNTFEKGDVRGGFDGSNIAINGRANQNTGAIQNTGTGSSTAGSSCIWTTMNAGAKISFNAEL